MSVEINSISFKNEFRNETTDWLLGVIGDKIIAEITCTVKSTVYLSSAVRIYFQNDYAYFIDAYNNPLHDWAYYSFYVGNKVTISGMGAPYDGNYIINSIDPDGIRAHFVIDPSLATPNFTPSAIFSTGSVNNTTKTTGINYRSNLIENSDQNSFLSLIDANENKWSLGTIDYTNTTYQTTIQQGTVNSNHLGQVRVKGVNTTLNRFVIEHTFYITPLFLLAQLTDLANGIRPEYYYDLSCLKYIFNVELLYQLSDPNRVHKSTTQGLIGNTGWFNENFNGGIPKFTADAPTYSQGGNPLTFADYQNDTDFSITVRSEEGVFSNNNTKFVLNHFFLPETEQEYINTSSDFVSNFMFDRKLNTVGSAAANGDNFGTQKQVLKNIAATFVSANEITVTGTISISSAYKAKVGAASAKQFVLFVTIQDHTKATAVSDKVACHNSMQRYDTDLSNASAGKTTIDMFLRNQNDLLSPVAFAGWFVEDDILSRSQFFVDTTNGATIENTAIIISAEHPTYGAFTLERKDFSFAGAIVQNGVQQININTTRGFNLRTGDQFNLVSLNRKNSLDSGNLKYYELFYGFRLRWEYFKQLLAVSNQFYDVNEDFNGFNHDWNRYFAGSGWEIKFKVVLTITENGVTNTIINDRTLYIYNYGDAGDWQNDEIKIFNNATSIDNGDFLPADDVQRVEAKFTYIGDPAYLPDIADIEGEVVLGRNEVDDENVVEKIFTNWKNSDGNALVSILGNNYLKKEFIAPDKYKFTCLIDNTKLNLLTSNGYRLSARIFDKTSKPIGPMEGSKQFMNGDGFEFMDNQPYDFMN